MIIKEIMNKRWIKKDKETEKKACEIQWKINSNVFTDIRSLIEAISKVKMFENIWHIFHGYICT